MTGRTTVEGSAEGGLEEVVMGGERKRGTELGKVGMLLRSAPMHRHRWLVLREWSTPSAGVVSLRPDVT
jgi:hypothetical protein